MATHEIRREGWEAFCDSFSRMHEGRQVDVEVRNGGEPRALVDDLPLEGITAELHVDGEDHVEVAAGGQPDRHIVHTVVRPARIFLDQTEDGVDKAVRIESSTGTETIVRFRTPVRPEMLNEL